MDAITPTPLTVVGAGPAGIMAAYTAAQAGISVTVIDDNLLPGGQYFRQSPPEFSIPNGMAAHSGHPEATAYYAKLKHPRIRTLYNTFAWGVFDKRVLALADQERVYFLETEKVVLATGAYDRPLAFPGWTLPGVQGAGGTMRMLKTQWLRPGKCVLLAGLGPLQLALADALLKADVQVACIAEAANPFRTWHALPKFWGHWDRLSEAFTYLGTIQRHRVPLFFKHAIIEATGTEHVESATIARLDAAGTPVPGTERRFEVDTVCLGYGLLPSFQLPAAFGSELRFDEQLCWWVPRHDSYMETTEPGIFVAGDVTDIGGTKVAALEGQIAGLTAARQLGYLDDANLQARLATTFAELRRLNRAAAALNRIYAFRSGLAFLARDDTMLCRCEEITLRQVKEALALGGIDLHQLKLRSRAGMGYCQGRNCSPLIAPIISKETGQPLASLKPFTIRPPLRPIPLELLATGANSLIPR